MTITISRLYNSYPDAQAAIDRLEAAGVNHSDVSVLASNADEWYRRDQGNKATIIPDRDLDHKDDRKEAAATVAGVGAVGGGALGALTGLGLLAIPGVGPVVAAGWLVATLAGAAAGGVAGGAIGALTQAGVSKEEADIYAEGLRRGGTVVTARVENADAPRLQEVLDNTAVRIPDRADLYRKSGWTKFDSKAPTYSAEQVRKERALY